jgi:hypothetical protein
MSHTHGTFRAPEAFAAPTSASGDGFPDIVVGNQNSQAISIFLGMEMEEFHLRSP